MPAIAKKESSERKIVAPFNRLKAAPELLVSCSCKNEPIMRLGSRPNVRRANDFVPLSMTIATRATLISNRTERLLGAQLLSAVPLSACTTCKE
jgi:hypothetical protein